MNSNRSRLEIHPKEGLKMDLVTDKWIRFCAGMAILMVGAGCFLLAATPFVSVVLQ